MPSRRKSSSDASLAGKKTALAKTSTTATESNPALVTDLRQIILSAREQVARAVDSGLALLYWSIGHRIRTDVLKEKRATYGKEIVSAVGRQLAVEFGDGFSDKNLRHMIRFAESFPESSILQSLAAKLSWTHFKSIIYLDDPLKARFLCGNVPDRELEHPDTPRKDRFHALRAHSSLEKARKARGDGTGQAPGRRPHDARSGIP